MNPPYSGNLHLKILREAMQHSDDIVNLSPIRWLEDPLAEYKKNSDFLKYEDIRNQIESLEEINSKQAQNFFNADIGTSLGIYYITKNGGWSPMTLHNPLVDKILHKTLECCKDFERNKKDGWRVKVSAIFGRGGHGGDNDFLVWQKLLVFYDGMKDNKPWYEHYNRNQWTKETPEIPTSFTFKSEQEANNFISATSSKLGRWYYNKMNTTTQVCPYYYLWLPTYKHPWTDADLYAYFGLTADEIGIIEKEMGKYKW
jgi:hypothetical protein